MGTVREAPHRDEREQPLTYWRSVRTAVGIAARRPAVRLLLLLSATFSVVPLIVYYFLLQPYALGVGLPLVSLGPIVVAIQLTSVAASWLAHRAGGLFELTSIVTVGAVLLVSATIVLGAAPSIPTVALMVVVALVPALVAPLLNAQLNSVIPSAQRGTILSLSALLAELGTAGAVPLLLALADVLSPAIAIGLSGSLFAVIAFPLLIVWRATDQPRVQPEAG